MALQELFSQLSNWRSWIPEIGLIDILEILIIAVVIYEIMLWVQSTRAWRLLRGFVFLVLLYLLASLLQMTTITWILDRTLNIGLLALIILFQPELRKALEQLGRQNMLALVPGMFASGKGKEGAFDDKVISELVAAAFDMGKVRTGALIVIERFNSLSEYEKTGIPVDGLVSRALLINIFEHNTPLHDGAVLIRGNRVVSATCYLPLSDNMAISKDLGTRHRAGVGISEVSDSVTIIVSEETGAVSLAFEGNLKRRLSPDELRTQLGVLMLGRSDERKTHGLKGRLLK